MSEVRKTRTITITSTKGGFDTIQTDETDFNKILQQINDNTSICTRGMKASLALDGDDFVDVDLKETSKLSSNDLVISFTPAKLKGGADLDSMGYRELKAEFKSLKTQALQSDLNMFNAITAKINDRNWTQFKTDELRQRLKDVQNTFLTEEVEEEIVVETKEVVLRPESGVANIDAGAEFLLAMNRKLDMIINALGLGETKDRAIVESNFTKNELKTHLTENNWKDVFRKKGLGHLT